MGKIKVLTQKFNTLDDFVFNFDLHNKDLEDEDYYRLAMNSDPVEMNRLLHGTIENRFKNGMNFIASIHGQQGSGKSLFGDSLGIILGKTFQMPYNIEKHLCWSPEELDQKITHSEKRVTWVLDEQRKANFGIMSNFIMESLIDYENQLRIDQANFIYISPELEQHSHFYVFKTLPEEIGIIRENDGYPMGVRVMVKSLRHKDDLMLPRGIVQLKAPERDIWARYNILKEQHIRDLKAKKRDILDPIIDCANRVIEEYGDELLKEKKDGSMSVISEIDLDLKVIKVIGAGKFTTKGYKLLNAQIAETLHQAGKV